MNAPPDYATSDRWLLPDGIDAVLPADAWALEALRRRLLDLYRRWGYRLVMPPLVEFLDALLTGTGNDLDLQTFKLIDQLSGRMLGVRADMTPQVARIDARGDQSGPARLCFMGTVLRTRDDGFGGSRSPLQFGVELYGHAGVDSDREVVELLLATLSTAGVADVHLDLGHVGAFRSLIRQGGLDADAESELFDLLQRKALAELDAWLTRRRLAAPIAAMLLALAELNGDADATLALARRRFADAGDALAALDQLSRLADALRRAHPQLPLHVDLAELRGYRYHTGLVFAAYVPGRGREIARGGRYDGIGRVFGRDRPATGFSADLKTLARLAAAPPPPPPAAIYAPADDDPQLARLVAELRDAGDSVIRALPGADADPAALGCDRLLARRGDGWAVVPLPAIANE